MRVLGINCFSRDTAACLWGDGRLVALAEEERFNRERHTKRFPDQAIGFCPGLAGIGIDQVDVVAFAQRPGLDLARGVADALGRSGHPNGRPSRPSWAPTCCARRPPSGPAGTTGPHHPRRPPRRPCGQRAFYPSPFEEAAVLTLDRGGDFLSTTLQVGSGPRLDRRLRSATPTPWARCTRP